MHTDFYYPELAKTVAMVALSEVVGWQSLDGTITTEDMDGNLLAIIGANGESYCRASIEISVGTTTDNSSGEIGFIAAIGSSGARSTMVVIANAIRISVNLGVNLCSCPIHTSFYYPELAETVPVVALSEVVSCTIVVIGISNPYELDPSNIFFNPLPLFLFLLSLVNVDVASTGISAGTTTDNMSGGIGAESNVVVGLARTNGETKCSRTILRSSVNTCPWQWMCQFNSAYHQS
ncbi:hypothetical protein Scep_025983 [Stephania cephalantha]|uniref:Uncharacterized protein n=1 Tax=Stephania cephalantha TaxID=152367 RepID=A0AAP0HPW0_9MAGN